VFSRATFILVTLLALLRVASAQDDVRFVRPGQSFGQQQQDELQDVLFFGLRNVRAEELLGIISSRPSELSLTRRMARYFSQALSSNSSTPGRLAQRLDRVQQDLADELRYYDERRANEDSSAILEYLVQNGYRKASLRKIFGRYKPTGKNTLAFVIDEGPRSVVDAIYYLGLDRVAPDVRKRVDESRTLAVGNPFSEAALETDIQNILATLRREGYYAADTLRAAVGLSKDLILDTVAVLFSTGPRYRIARIDFVENRLRSMSADGLDSSTAPTVITEARARQIEFAVGQWYNADKVAQSRFNLIALGTFDNVTIDTVGTHALSTTDSLLVMRVFTKNAKHYDAGLDFLLYQTAIDNYLNLGVGVTALHRNLFGSAQQATATVQFALQDISRVFQQQTLETETLARFNFIWPSAFRLAGLRASINSEAFYSLRRLIDPFRLESAGMIVRVPVPLHSFTFFNGFEGSAAFERQIPRGFQGARDDALVNAQTALDTLNVEQTFLQFSALDRFLTEEGGFLTGTFLGFTVRGEHRNNPVNPTSGTFTSVSAEFGWGAGKFWRIQFFNTTYSPLHSRLVAATKVRLGHIFLINPSNTYVPLERQFFAGGAASIRSFASRQLHDPRSGVIKTDEDREQRIINNILGSASLLELGAELRYTFARPTALPDIWATFIERSGLTFFVDVGNAYNRLTPQLYGSMRLADVYQGAVVASGLGYRFETPVGPFRIDYATSVFDPLRADGSFIFSGRENLMGFVNWQLSIGLGHAF
jgi:outer membrane protein assembly factor BamA